MTSDLQTQARAALPGIAWNIDHRGEAVGRMGDELLRVRRITIGRCGRDWVARMGPDQHVEVGYFDTSAEAFAWLQARVTERRDALTVALEGNQP